LQAAFEKVAPPFAPFRQAQHRRFDRVINRLPSGQTLQGKEPAEKCSLVYDPSVTGK